MLPSTQTPDWIERLAVAAMGTRFELVLPGADTPARARRLRAAGEAALAVIAECDARYSAFRRDSLVARIDREAHRWPVRVDEQTYALLSACVELWHATGGAFDVGLGRPLAALGLRGRIAAAAGFEPCAGPPYELDPRSRSVRAVRAGAAMDLGGVAKGFALDLAARELAEAGVASALLHGGTSSVTAIGAPPGEEAWWVAVAAPEGAEPGPAVALAGASLAVSAAAGRTARDASGRAGGHVLDPRSGRAAPLGTVAAVVAESGLAADAWSTALVASAASGENPRPIELPPGAAAAVLPGDGGGGGGARAWSYRGAHARCFRPRPAVPSSNAR